MPLVPRIFVVTPHDLMASIVNEIYEIEAGQAITVEIVNPNSLDTFTPPPRSFVLIDQHHRQGINTLQKKSLELDFFIVPFDEADFGGIYTSITLLINQSRRTAPPELITDAEYVEL